MSCRLFGSERSCRWAVRDALSMMDKTLSLARGRLTEEAVRRRYLLGQSGPINC